MISIVRSGSSLIGRSGSGGSINFTTSNISLDQLLSLKALNDELGGKTKITWNDKNGTVSFIQFNESNNKLLKNQLNIESRKTAAINFLSRYKNILKMNDPLNELKIVQTEIEDNGLTHIKYEQFYKGIRVWGGYLYAHINSYGNMQCINGRYEVSPVSLSAVSYGISPDDAVAVSSNDLNYTGRNYTAPKVEKIIYHDYKNVPHLAYFVELKPTMIDVVYYFIDGITGKIIHKYNNTKTDGPIIGSGIDLLGKTRSLNIFQKGSQYYLIDASKDMYNAQSSQMPDNPQGAITVLDLKNAEQSQNSQFYYVSSSSANSWPQNAVSLSNALSIAYDYYKNVHGIKSWDNNGMNVYGVVNLGQNYLNAYSTGTALFFGNGDNKSYQDFTRAIDIIGHEFGHSVTTYHSNLEYQYQSGALNEAYSDYSGSMIEFYNDPNNANWLIGENAIAASSGKIAGRDMANPANPLVMDILPTKMSEYMSLTADQDNGGVHINCGIPSRAFYLIAQSIGRDKMEKIIYRAYTKYLTQKSQFIDLRIAAIQAAKDLYPGSGYENQIGQAFDVVEIFDGTGTKPPQELPAVSGQDYIMMLGSDGKIYRAKSTIPFDQTSLFNFGLVAKNKPSITENGSFITFVGSDNNIYLISVNEGKYYQITTDGKWNNVALSPKGEYIAAIPDPNYEPAKIYVLNTGTSAVEARTLYIPNTSENNVSTYAYYADIVDFSTNGDYLLYDCYSVKKLQTGNLIDTWQIMLMRRNDGVIISVFPPTADGIMVGNPSFANTKENLIAFDLVDARDQNNLKCYVSTYDMFSGELGLLNDNSNWLGYPSFSPDDKKVVFQTKGTNGLSTNLSQISMSSDGLNAVQSSKTGYLTNAMAPVWYATGSRPVGINEPKADEPKSYELLASYPNPFNSTATIKYYLPKQANVKIEIYNLIGNKVKELYSGNQESGYHNILWNAEAVATGTYYCRMTTPEVSKTIKLVLVK
jgi:Zn-dependent metalloprotease